MIYYNDTSRKKEKVIYISELLFHNGKLRRKNYHLTNGMEDNNLIYILIYFSL